MIILENTNLQISYTSSEANIPSFSASSKPSLNKSLFKFCLVTFLSPPVSPFPQLNRT